MFRGGRVDLNGNKISFGDINLSGVNNKLILSGGRNLYAGEDIKNTTVNEDYYFSKFKFKYG